MDINDRARVLTVLHKTRAFLPRALWKDADIESLTPRFWEELLSAAQTNLSATSNDPQARIRIVGQSWLGLRPLKQALSVSSIWRR